MTANLQEYKGWSRIIASLRLALRDSRSTRVVGLQSGEGEVWQYLYPALTDGGWPLFVLLTDPNPWDAAAETFRANAEKGISYYPEGVDAVSVPYSLPGFRVLFEDFQRLPELRFLRVLGDAVYRNQGIAIVAKAASETFTSEEMWDMIERVPGNENYVWEVRAEEKSLVVGYPARSRVGVSFAHS